MINRDNYEEVMFGMVEGLYSEAELQALLQQIETDPFLTAEWSRWAASQLKDDLSAYVPVATDWATAYLTHKKHTTTLGVRYIRRAGRVAATIALLLGCWYILREPRLLPESSHRLTGQGNAAADHHPANLPTIPPQFAGRTPSRVATEPVAHIYSISDEAVSTVTLSDTGQQTPTHQQAGKEELPAGKVVVHEPQLAIVEESTQLPAAPLFTVSIHTEIVNDNAPPTSRTNRQAKDLLTNSQLRFTTDQTEGGPQLLLQGTNHATLQLSLQKEVHHR